jgi:hypothetical protein
MQTGYPVIVVVVVVIVEITVKAATDPPVRPMVLKVIWRSAAFI